MTLNHDGDKGTHPDDPMRCVVPKPFQNGDHEFCSRAGVAHGRQNFGVKQSGYAVANLKIHPADGLAIAKSGNAFVRNLNVHAFLLLGDVRRH